MKTITSFIALLLMLNHVSAQQTYQICTNENFSGQTSGWTYSQGAHIGDYTNPTQACADDRGIITPGVGGNNPCNIQTPLFTSTGAAMIDLSFDIIVLNANLKCNTWKNYACETSIDVFYYIGTTKYTGITDFVLPPNGPTNPTKVSLSFNAGNNLPEGTVYKIEMCFKPKSGTGNCIQQNTKYVFDNFRNCETPSREISERQSTTETKEMDFSIFPNPTKGATKITVNTEPGTTRISLMDKVGNTLRTTTGTSFIMFDIKDFPTGKYFIEFEKANGMIIKKPFTIN